MLLCCPSETSGIWRCPFSTWKSCDFLRGLARWVLPTTSIPSKSQKSNTSWGQVRGWRRSWCVVVIPWDGLTPTSSLKAIGGFRKNSLRFWWICLHLLEIASEVGSSMGKFGWLLIPKPNGPILWQVFTASKRWNRCFMVVPCTVFCFESPQHGVGTRSSLGLVPAMYILILLEVKFKEYITLQWHFWLTSILGLGHLEQNIVDQTRGDLVIPDWRCTDIRKISSSAVLTVLQIQPLHLFNQFTSGWPSGPDIHLLDWQPSLFSSWDSMMGYHFIKHSVSNKTQDL